MAGPSGATARLALPYPTPDDSVDVPRDVRALADRLDVLPGIPQPALVTSLPASPVDGQEIYFQADAINSVIWHLRYRASSGSAYKWEYVGGPALYNYVGIQDSFSNVNWAHLPNSYGPVIVLPLTGDYEITFGAANVQVSGPGVVPEMGFISEAPGPSTPDFYEALASGAFDTKIFASVGMTLRRTIGGTAICVYRVASGGVGYWMGRYLSLRPVRVG